MPYSPFATYGFVGTNYNKVSNGDWTRYPVLGGQLANGVEYSMGKCAEKSSIFARSLNSAKTKLSALANNSKIFKGIEKTVKFTQNNINPLIVASGITKVALAEKEDREKTIFSEGGMIAGMFAGEGWMKKHLEKKVLSKLPVDKKWAPVAKGVLFVTGSLTASAIGQKAGETTFKVLEKSRQKTNSADLTMAQKSQSANGKLTRNSNRVYEPLELNA